MDFVNHAITKHSTSSNTQAKTKLESSSLSSEALNYALIDSYKVNNTVLATILNRKVADLPKIKALAQSLSPRKAQGERFLKALEQAKQAQRPSFILECKRASPSLGAINLDLDFAKYAQIYSEQADVISVLTEEHFFCGSFQFLAEVVAKSSRPVLCKDFVICEEQLDLACAYGASAVLLMLSVLTEEGFTKLYQQAISRGLAVLCEVSSKEEAQLALKLQCPVIGINNRNLKELTIDLAQSAKLAKVFQNFSGVIISESGIKTHEDLIYVQQSSLDASRQVDGFLIGSAICGSSLPLNVAINELKYGLNKICALNTQEAIKAAIAHNLCLAGLIFYKKSPRYINKAQAQALISSINSQENLQERIAFCGVFVDEDIDEIVTIAKELKLDFIQLHGHEDFPYIEKLKQNLQAQGLACKIMKAVKCAIANIAETDDFQRSKNSQIDFAKLLKLVDYVLLDSPLPGSGQTIDLSLLKQYQSQGLKLNRTLLAGGIGVENITKARQYGFHGVDCNSKLEESPGVKSVELIHQCFFEQSRY